MTEKTPSAQSLDALQELFKQGAFDQVRSGLRAYLDATPDDADALALQNHLDHLETLEKINQAVLGQDWEQTITEVQAAIKIGLTWDIELRPLADLLANARERRAETGNLQAQSLLKQAQQAQEREDLDQARELYAQALAMPHLPPALRAQFQRRLDALRPGARTSLSTVSTLMQPDALMEELVGTILKKSRPQLAEAVRLCAIPFWFDLELLRALRASDDSLDEKILARMARFSFVQQDDRGRYTFSQDVRRYLLGEWGQDHAGFVEANRRAQSYFVQALKASCPDGAVVDALGQPGETIQLRALVGTSPQVSELVQSHLYHTLAVDGDAGIVLLRQLFHAADEAHRLALAERCLAVADEQRSLLKPDQRAHVDYMRGLLDQLQGRWEASCKLFERMLEREGLSTTLQARVRRALGNALVQQEQWVEAIALFETALQNFRAAGDDLETALTMISLGRAHLDLALNTWGGGEAFALRRGWLDCVQDIAMLVGRLPIAVYLMRHLGVRALLPVILRIGRGMDWVVARLFVIAAEWFNHADVILRRLDDQEGLGRVEENLAWLFLLLGHFGRAEMVYRRLLAREGSTLGEYRAARARLGLARALMHQGLLAEARELLEQVLPIFVAYQHAERIAETQRTLAQTFALGGQPAQAVPHYQQAAGLYQQLGDDANATEAVEQMQLLLDEAQTDSETRQAIAASAAQITHRRYLTRFSLPLLYVFRLLALTGLAGVFIFSLSTSIHVESGTDFGVGEAFLGSRQSFTSALEPDVGFDLIPRLNPSLDVSFALYLVVVLFIVYLMLYTALGLWLTVRTSLRTLQEGQRFDVIIDPQGVGRGVAEAPGSLKIQWSQVAALLASDRSLLSEPIPLFSRFAVFGEQGAVVIDGQTCRYLAARNLIQQHLNQPTNHQTNKQINQPTSPIPTHNFGFSILYSHSGRLFAGTLLFILAFVFSAQIAPDLLTTQLGPLPYSLSDLYNVSYLGLLIPLGWWLAVQPLRERLFLKPHTRRVWLIGLVGLGLAVFAFLDITWLHLAGRPNIASGLFATFLMGLAAYYVGTTRRWEHMPFRRGRHVYSSPVRLVSAAVALVAISLSLVLVVREANAYHYLAWARVNRQRAADAEEAGDEARAEALYQETLASYQRVLRWVGDDADIYHSQGAILTQMGRYAEAVASIQQAIALQPGRSVYHKSLAITYEIWGDAQDEAGDEESALEYYQSARDNYTIAIEQAKKTHQELKTTHLLRAGALFKIGEYYRGEAKHVADQPDLASQRQRAAVENFQAAQDDYAWVAEMEPENAAALSGLGWTEFRLAKLDQEALESRVGLETALDYFEQAADADPKQTSAWSGQGWAHFAIGETYTWWDEEQRRTRSACADSERNPTTPAKVQIYQEENLQAIAAFEQAATLAPDDPSLKSVQGYLYFNLVNCPDVDNTETYLAAVESFSQALALEPDNLEWLLRRANLYYALGPDYYAQSSADYEQLVSLNPNAGWYWTLGNIYRSQDQLEQATQAYASSAELDPDNYRHQALLGWYAYQSGDYDISIQASQAASALDPTEPRTVFNWGLALVAQGDAEQAWQVYADGIVVANALVDEEVRLARYQEALDDLGGVTQDPAGIAAALRARLTFKQGLTYVELGAADEAQSAYQDGVAIASELEDEEIQLALYNETVDDLRALDAEPRLAARMMRLLEAAWDED
jgi:tetratricopeptide (TPR) repeat protein